MTERIDQGTVDKIVAAKKAGTLEILAESDLGAHVKFPHLQTTMDMHLSRENWVIVKAALAEVSDEED